MITVVIYALNDAQTISACLSSLVSQRPPAGLDVVVLDDGSRDQTAAIVARQFPQFRLMREDQTLGWVRALRKHVPDLHASRLAFLGAHCRAEPGWLAAAEKEMARGRPVVTGSGHHGRESLPERFQAIVLHADAIPQREADVPFLWDDDFAILPDLLEQHLPRSEMVLSDGAGATLLSRNLLKAGIAIAYRPAMRVNHVTHPWRKFVALWYGELAVNCVATKRADPTSPGARWLWLGPLAALALAGKRWLQGVRDTLRARPWLRISWLEVALHACLLALCMPVYWLGLCREMFAPNGAK